MGCIRRVLVASGLLLTFFIMLAVILYFWTEPDRDDLPATATAFSGNLQPTPTVSQPAPGADLQQASVEWITDGDTIHVRIGGETESVRLIGIDTPEVSDSAADADCYSAEAERYLTDLINGATVWLEPDVNDRDRYGRLLRYVWIRQADGYVMVNQILVGNGLAVARQYAEDVRYADRLAETERDAIRSRRGIWSACVTAEHQNTPGAPNFWDGERDLDCADFSTRVNAQAFYAATGGPATDPFNLDSDHDGLICHTRPPTEPR
jgi:micrococcal nuclease